MKDKKHYRGLKFFSNGEASAYELFGETFIIKLSNLITTYTNKVIEVPFLEIKNLADWKNLGKLQIAPFSTKESNETCFVIASELKNSKVGFFAYCKERLVDFSLGEDCMMRNSSLSNSTKKIYKAPFFYKNDIFSKHDSKNTVFVSATVGTVHGNNSEKCNAFFKFIYDGNVINVFWLSVKREFSYAPRALCQYSIISSEGNSSMLLLNDNNQKYSLSFSKINIEKMQNCQGVPNFHDAIKLENKLQVTHNISSTFLGYHFFSKNSLFVVYSSDFDHGLDEYIDSNSACIDYIDEKGDDIHRNIICKKLIVGLYSQNDLLNYDRKEFNLDSNVCIGIIDGNTHYKFDNIQFLQFNFDLNEVYFLLIMQNADNIQHDYNLEIKIAQLCVESGKLLIPDIDYYEIDVKTYSDAVLTIVKDYISHNRCKNVTSSNSYANSSAMSFFEKIPDYYLVSQKETNEENQILSVAQYELINKKGEKFQLNSTKIENVLTTKFKKTLKNESILSAENNSEEIYIDYSKIQENLYDKNTGFFLLEHNASVNGCNNSYDKICPSNQTVSTAKNNFVTNCIFFVVLPFSIFFLVFIGVFFYKKFFGTNNSLCCNFRRNNEVSFIKLKGIDDACNSDDMQNTDSNTVGRLTDVSLSSDPLENTTSV